MVNFLNIELDKYKVSKLLGTFILYNGIMFCLLLALGLSTSGIAMFPTMEIAIHEVNNSLIWPSCILVTGIWSSKIFIQEFRDKTIMNIFSSGVKRSSITLTKILLILAISFIFTIISTLLQDFLLNITSSFTYYTEEILNGDSFYSLEFTSDLIFNAGVLSITALISIALGLIRYSTSMTFVGALLLAFIWSMQLSFSNLNLNVNEIRLFLGIMGILCGLYILRKITTADI